MLPTQSINLLILRVTIPTWSHVDLLHHPIPTSSKSGTFLYSLGWGEPKQGFPLAGQSPPEGNDRCLEHAESWPSPVTSVRAGACHDAPPYPAAVID